MIGCKFYVTRCTVTVRIKIFFFQSRDSCLIMEYTFVAKCIIFYTEKRSSLCKWHNVSLSGIEFLTIDTVVGKLKIIEALMDDHEQWLQMTETYNCRRTTEIGRQLSTPNLPKRWTKGKKETRWWRCRLRIKAPSNGKPNGTLRVAIACG